MILRNRILNATYQPGQRIPGESEFIKEFGVSRMTVRQALDKLADEGLIVRRQGVGTLVSKNVEPSPVALTGYLDDLMLLFAQTQVVDVSVAKIPIPSKVAEFLQPGVATPGTCARITRVRKKGPQMFSFAQSYISPVLGAALRPQELSQHLLFELLESKFGVVLAEAFQVIRCRRAPPTIAKHLQLAEGDPILSIEFRYLGSGKSDGRSGSGAAEPIALSYVDIRPDALSYQVRLVRIR